MSQTVFVAYASGNDYQATIITEAAAKASTADRIVKPWSTEDPSGAPIAQSVEDWIIEADTFIADISRVNMNVTYELGYAIGLGKPIRVVRSRQIEFASIKKVGLLDSIAHDGYDYQPSLAKIFARPVPEGRWKAGSRNRDQPVFILQPPLPMEWSRKAVSGIKKIARVKFRNFNPTEISRLNASEAFEHVSASFGLVTFWLDGTDEDAVQHNQRTCFMYGVARGLGIPALLIAHQSTQLPLDVHDSANRWDHLDQIDGIISAFRDAVSDEVVNYSEKVDTPDTVPLKLLNFGDPVAENEQAHLASFFLETDAFRRTEQGQAHVLVGRKGSGKSAIFLQARDRCRSNKQNIVIDLMPEGYHLIKLKEFVLDQIGYGTRKEVIAAFWEYVLWLEIAYKLLEKDSQRARRDHTIFEMYSKLESFFQKRVDTGIGDFSERLRLLSDNVIARFQSRHGASSTDAMKSSEVLEIIYGSDIRELRDAVTAYLKIKGYVFFLFDNLDRIWTPGGFDEADALILIGLAEAMQEISRKFGRVSQEFRWAIFIRSDVYELLVAGMADYGKLAVQSLEWTDREQLKALFNQRLLAAAAEVDRPMSLRDISDDYVLGRPVLEFLIDGSMMRPRYLIRLFETARRRALTLGRNRIAADDYEFAIIELGWQVLEDLNREIVDLVPSGSDIIFEILSQREGLTPDKFRYIAGSTLANTEDMDRLIDVMIWSGSLGIVDPQQDKYIFNCGYRRQFLAAQIRKNSNLPLVLHPTLCATAA